eukprot:NODE_1711_length_782_cov_125.257844_g1331_i0.p1 GENE.NODE_1711_length_782_cov_125.257844_g1331_i0~~NODE_1711_length_782_cov_125.257844_g1331_i0.p1  ORF type:complete len:201 (+),score=40.39 NODE_1711_length_782_cov_125.257844_g1331_i0:107-709(+)
MGGGGDWNERTSRGGRTDFNWDELKGDKNAAIEEYYLGRSEKCEDLWYKKTKPTKIPSAVPKELERRSEMSAIQKAEQEMFKAALGLQTKRSVVDTLTPQQVDLLLGKHGSTLPAPTQRSAKRDLGSLLMNGPEKRKYKESSSDSSSSSSSSSSSDSTERRKKKRKRREKKEKKKVRKEAKRLKKKMKRENKVVTRNATD